MSCLLLFVQEYSASWCEGVYKIYGTSLEGLCDLVAPLVLKFRKSMSKATMFGYILKIQNISSHSSIRGVLSVNIK